MSQPPAEAGQPPADESGRSPELPVLPYGKSTLAELIPSVLAALGLPGEANPLGFPPADGVCVLLVDGLGLRQLEAVASERPRIAPTLAGLLADGRVLSTACPATTATSLGSIGTGEPPGRHGLLGYQVAVPGEGWLLNELRWDPRIDPVAWQPLPTRFERAMAAGIDTVHVSAPEFEGSPLTLAALRGARYLGAQTGDDRVAAVLAELRDPGRRLVFAYSSWPDSVGHVYGIGSAAWLAALAEVDRLVGELRAGLPAGAVLYVTSDHGMVDVPEGARIDADVEPELSAGVALLGGEARARHVYAEPGAAGEVLDRWRGRLGEAFWVLPRTAAIDAGLFGPTVSPQMRDRIGDVVALARTDAAVIASEAEPKESALIGMHGSITAAERLVPLLTVTR